MTWQVGVYYGQKIQRLALWSTAPNVSILNLQTLLLVRINRYCFVCPSICDPLLCLLCSAYSSGWILSILLLAWESVLCVMAWPWPISSRSLSQALQGAPPCPGINISSIDDAIWRHGSLWTLVQVMACCLTAPSHWTNVDLSPVEVCGTHLRPISQDMLKTSIHKMSLKKYTCKITSTSLRSQWINTVRI